MGEVADNGVAAIGSIVTAIVTGTGIETAVGIGEGEEMILITEKEVEVVIEATLQDQEVVVVVVEEEGIAIEEEGGPDQTGTHEVLLVFVYINVHFSFCQEVIRRD